MLISLDTYSGKRFVLKLDPFVVANFAMSVSPESDGETNGEAVNAEENSIVRPIQVNGNQGTGTVPRGGIKIKMKSTSCKYIRMAVGNFEMSFNHESDGETNSEAVNAEEKSIVRPMYDHEKNRITGTVPRGGIDIKMKSTSGDYIRLAVDSEEIATLEATLGAEEGTKRCTTGDAVGFGLMLFVALLGIIAYSYNQVVKSK